VTLPHNLIFQEYGVLYDNAIILAMEMSKEKIDKAPSQATMNMVFGTYDDLGKAANKIAEFLREYGFAAQADHPLGGLVLFPPLAARAQRTGRGTEDGKRHRGREEAQRTGRGTEDGKRHRGREEARVPIPLIFPL
jgi:hypothetical protein